MSACQSSKNIGGKKNQAKEESKKIADALEIQNSNELEVSTNLLHEKGCGVISQVEKTEEKDGWIYFIVIDENGKRYFADTNKKGNFGTVLSDSGYENALLFSNKLGIEENRNLLYSAGYLEDCGCGKIESISNLANNNTYQFLCEDNKNVTYRITMTSDGRIGRITKDGKELFAKPE